MTSERLLLLAARMEIEAEFLEECARWGIVVLEELPERVEDVPPAQLARLRRVQRICRGLDLDVFAAGIIVDLLDRIEALERERGSPAPGPSRRDPGGAG